jgi:hypothetical protein
MIVPPIDLRPDPRFINVMRSIVASQLSFSAAQSRRGCARLAIEVCCIRISAAHGF